MTEPHCTRAYTEDWHQRLTEKLRDLGKGATIDYDLLADAVQPPNKKDFFEAVMAHNLDGAVEFRLHVYEQGELKKDFKFSTAVPDNILDHENSKLVVQILDPV